ncbi:MAG: hypothetical protein HY537_16750 [Deltaproteobacteria bacterium]|nr:hypothetical protein [Deltaproteobacteria bacterium]
MKFFCFSLLIAAISFLGSRNFAFASEPATWQDFLNLFESGTVLNESEIPDYGVLHTYSVYSGSPTQIDPPKQEGHVFYRMPKTASSPGGILIAIKQNPYLSDADAVKHISDCNRFIPSAQIDAGNQALAHWGFYSNVRAAGMNEQGQPRAALQVYNLFRRAVLPGTQRPVIVYRVDTSEPGYRYSAGNISSYYRQGDFYGYGYAISPITPSSAVSSNCNALMMPGFRFITVQPYSNVYDLKRP